ncbi:deoxyribodipyrimidine photo-lyase [Brevundimonas sp.]|uniref:cryptochrome/photolyase family protein n=1 Tax=Brevundimonas sp. TaxID=1871086 RepID=UPI002EDB6C2C
MPTAATAPGEPEAGADAGRPVIVWFRRDLRLADNPALAAAAATGRAVIPLYILDEGSGAHPLGGASRWWLDRSLAALERQLELLGSPLVLRRGRAELELIDVVQETGAAAVFMNRLFEPEAWARDADIAHELKAAGVECRGFNGTLLSRPGEILTGAGQPYRVFTPFLKALLAQVRPPVLPAAPSRLTAGPNVRSEDRTSWGLGPRSPDWSTGFEWKPGEAGAGAALSTFVAGGLADYSRGRDRPASNATSRLSPHLHWGEVHPWRVVETVRAAAETRPALAPEVDKFVAEIVWREFSAHLLHHFPTLPERSFHPKYDAMAWRRDEGGFAAWTRGRTGYPIVDAGMRQLWTTGWMHNRVRMIVASFLVKDLLIDWRKGQDWFRDTLVDADLASNSQNWQWVAGSGADASPFFRVFNPVTQGEKFDPDGEYVRRWVPELARLPSKWIHAPFAAPAQALRGAGVRLGESYPEPIVDHAAARLRALAALKAVNEGWED